MRSESSAARAGHSDARVTLPPLKNRNRSGRPGVAGIRVTSAGKYGRGAMVVPAVSDGEAPSALAAPGVTATMPVGRATEATIQPRTLRLETPPDAGVSGLAIGILSSLVGHGCPPCACNIGRWEAALLGSSRRSRSYPPDP